MPLINQKDIDDIKAAMAELAPFTEEPITYRTFTGMTPGDLAAGVPDAPNFIDTVETAIVQELSIEEVAVSGGVYVLGDMEFSIRRVVQPAYNDRIVYGGITWKPKSIRKVFLGEVLWWEVRAGRE